MKNRRRQLWSCSIVFIYLALFLFDQLFSINLFSQTQSFFISPLFTDSMVLQQQTQVPIWGRSIPGKKIEVSGSWGKKIATVVAKDSTWTIKLKTPKPGGPFQVTIQEDDSLVVLHDVLIGEVWFCSGQSNMEMPMDGGSPTDTVMNFQYEIAHALYPKIRLFHVAHAFKISPIKECVGKWQECTPLNVRSFSAAAFFFGRKIFESTKIPIGLIEASWGGTPVEAWTSASTLQTIPEYKAIMNQLDACKDSLKMIDMWLSQLPSLNVNSRDPKNRWDDLKFNDEECSNRNYPDSVWLEMNLPTYWEKTSLGEFDGAVWFRKSVEIPLSWKKKPLTLHLGPVDDMDQTYINGIKIGECMKDGYWNVNRVYSIPDSVVTDSIIQIAVRVVDGQGGGGIWGNGKPFCISAENDSTGRVVPLSGAWKFLPVAEYREGVFSIFGSKGEHFKDRPRVSISFTPSSPSSLYNGMISPVVPFAIRGVIWYQGEANVDNPALYERAFPSLITDWREAFQVRDFPFNFVQLAPFDYGQNSKSQLLREAQLKTLSVKNTGMAVTLDIGNPKNIHPTNKQEVGKRLALWALAKTYGKKMTFSGPLYKSMKSMNGKIILSFDHAEKGLVVTEKNGNNNLLIAGKDKMFKPAVVIVKGDKLILSHPEIPNPIAVRYAWSNVEEGTLFNKVGLPAPSFRTDDWNE